VVQLALLALLAKDWAINYLLASRAGRGSRRSSTISFGPALHLADRAAGTRESLGPLPALQSSQTAACRFSENWS